MPQPPFLTDPVFLQSSILKGVTVTVNDFLPPKRIVASGDVYDALFKAEMELVELRAANKRAGDE